MIKKNILLLLITFLMILPFSVNAGTQNSLILDSDVSVQAGETASFNISVGLTSALDQRVTKIEFEIAKIGGITGQIEYALAGPNSLFFSSPEENKFIVTKGPKETDIITDNDMIAKISIPVNKDCPEGDIEVTIKNIKFTYLPVEDSNSSSSSTIISPVIVDGVGSTKTITVEKKSLSNIAKLKTLTFTTGVPSPSFSSDIYEYEIILKDTVKSTTITAECSDNCSSINGVTSPWSQKINLVEGETQNIEVKVISENLKNSEKYLVRITRGQISKDNVKLKSLSIKDVVLDSEFSSDKFNYYATVPYEIDNVEILYDLIDTTSDVIITGNEALIVGEENAIKISVKSADENNELIYTVYVTREEESSSSSSSSSEAKSSSTNNPKEINKYTIVGLIIFGSLIIISVSFYLLFKKNKNHKIKDTNKSKDQPVVSISHDQDLELLELTKEYVGLIDKINNKENNDKKN